MYLSAISTAISSGSPQSVKAVQEPFKVLKTKNAFLFLIFFSNELKACDFTSIQALVSNQQQQQKQQQQQQQQQQ